MKKKGLLIVVSGPSAAGKGTICKALLEKNKNLKLSVSATTRNPRAGEIDGVNYHFLTKEKFQSMIKNGDFFEYATVYDNFYGTLKQEVLDDLNNGEDVLLEIDIQGAINVKKQYSDAVLVFILPPSLKELQNRIQQRGTENKEDIQKRMGSALKEIEHIISYDYFIINKEVDKSTEELQDIIKAEKNKVNRYEKSIIDIFKEEI